MLEYGDCVCGVCLVWCMCGDCVKHVWCCVMHVCMVTVCIWCVSCGAAFFCVVIVLCGNCVMTIL